jgi:glyoxylase-like metal-dependent hydrolase (beta-lactamase superfamily II)
MKKALAASILAAALCACAEPQTAAPVVRLYAMDCGRIHVRDAADYADDGAFNGVARDFADPCYLIRHPAGDLLWDLGLPPSIAESAEGVVFGVHVLTMPARLGDQLAQLGLAPADIEYVSISHSHFDHIGHAALFAPTATWIVDADERAQMFREEARGMEGWPLIAPLEHARTVLIEGDARHDVFGDGSVTIIQAPGHTLGHTILLVRTANSGNVLLTGDMYHLAESRERRTVPAFNADRAQTLQSMDLVESIAAAENARMIRQHVPEDMQALPRFPEALS